MIYSFDVFDTVITRSCGSPEGVFAIMQEKLVNKQEYAHIIEMLRYTFFHQRIFLEKQARSISKAEDLTITDIYDQIQKVFFLTNDQKQALVDLELETERQCCLPVEENILEIEALLAKGKKVIFVSDMYLRTEDIHGLLTHAAPLIADRCDLFASSDLKKTKHRGTLFSYVLDYYGIPPEMLTHKGDKKFSDIKAARRLGINTVHYKKTHSLNREMDEWLNKDNIHMPSFQKTLGISRYVSLLNNENRVSQVGALFAAPWLMGFAIWLKKNLEEGLHKSKDIYFLARDGEILIELLKLIPGRLTKNIRYLYMSRQASLIASLVELNQFSLDYLFQGYPDLNISMLAERCFLSVDEFRKVLPPEYQNHNENKKLSKTSIKKIRSSLITSESFRKYLLDKAAEQRELLVQYLMQEGVFENDDFVIVDLGWQCTIQDALFNIVKDRVNNVWGYYFGISKYSQPVSPRNRKQSYLFTPACPAYQYNKPYYVVFMELFCSSFDDTTKGFVINNDKVVPIKNSINKAALSWLADLRSGIKTYFDLIQKAHRLEEIDFKSTANLIMDRIEHPSKKWANIIGHFEYSADPFDSDLKLLAPKFTFWNLITKKARTKWIIGSAKNSGIPVLACYYMAEYLFSFIPRLKDYIIRVYRS